MLLTFKESSDLRRFADAESDEIADDIITRYNVATPEGLKMALKHAAYVGYCVGKGYDK